MSSFCVKPQCLPSWVRRSNALRPPLEPAKFPCPQWVPCSIKKNVGCIYHGSHESHRMYFASNISGFRPECDAETHSGLHWDPPFSVSSVHSVFNKIERRACASKICVNLRNQCDLIRTSVESPWSNFRPFSSFRTFSEYPHRFFRIPKITKTSKSTKTYFILYVFYIFLITDHTNLTECISRQTSVDSVLSATQKRTQVSIGIHHFPCPQCIPCSIK